MITIHGRLAINTLFAMWYGSLVATEGFGMRLCRLCMQKEFLALLYTYYIQLIRVPTHGDMYLISSPCIRIMGHGFDYYTMHMSA